MSLFFDRNYFLKTIRLFILSPPWPHASSNNSIVVSLFSIGGRPGSLNLVKLFPTSTSLISAKCPV